MCQVVESEFFLVQKLRKSGSCSIQELFIDREHIEQKHPGIIIDVSKSSIICTVNRYPFLFTWVENRVKKAKDAVMNPDLIKPEINLPKNPINIFDSKKDSTQKDNSLKDTTKKEIPKPEEKKK